MRKLGLLIAVFAVISCQEKVPVDYALVSGKIANKQGGEIIITNQSESSKQIIEVAEDGRFSDTLRFEKGAYYLIEGKQNAQIYVDAGANIIIDYDVADFTNTLSFTGPGSEISSYLLQKGRITKEKMGDRKEFYALDETAYKAKSFEIKNALNELINGTEGISDEYKALELNNINYEYLNRLGIYEQYHAHFAEIEGFKVSEGFLDELSDLDYTNEKDFLFSSDYQKLVSSNYGKQAAEIVKVDSTILPEIAYLKAVNSGSSQAIKDKLLFQKAQYEITYTDDVNAYYNEFIAGSKNEENNALITESYNKLKTVARGNPSPTFESFENYNGGTTSLADLKGKFVYVDVWATWCGPCKREIPSLKEVEKAYHGKNIEFVSISVDALKDHDKWKAMIAEKDLQGVQLFADKSWDSDFVKGYLIKGIPRFILIDTEGNIISANAPRPSSPKLIDLFNEFNI